MTLATLYSFRRCPYAMRARLGIYLSGSQVMLREIILKHKPQPMLDASPKGTVPVLITCEQEVIDESLEIMQWALTQNDPHNLLLQGNLEQQKVAMALIRSNDENFKPWLDRYKYADRYPEFSDTYYREKGEQFISQLEQLLTQSDNLLGHHESIADHAIYPFVRQFAHVDKTWFEQAPYPNLQKWLANHLNSDAFITIMKKYPLWLDNEQEYLFGAGH
ncbi:glutathione S-transferase [Shewanella nanhaiensis]|uniref:Glutathione S-transferase n=1 Tax=Shewanella nanhaiensis TaxID=2864872 RepID=A0ABS7E2F7_9GAMM|nr:glutathione S-transferase [Shewanella nanhaiensis]MBW8183846.1 glutathione S-transferase [Shewanella nanhaiensis]